LHEIGVLTFHQHWQFLLLRTLHHWLFGDVFYAQLQFAVVFTMTRQLGVSTRSFFPFLRVVLKYISRVFYFFETNLSIEYVFMLDY
jgi:hypothetical protein